MADPLTPTSLFGPPPSTPATPQLRGTPVGTGPGQLGAESLRLLILSKEKELHDMTEFQLKALQEKLDRKDAELHDLGTRFDKLKGDFTFNLKLIDERDTELQQYDDSFASLQALLHAKELELSDAKVAAAELEAARNNDQKHLSEQEAYLQSKLREAREQAEAAKWAHDEELRRQRDEAEALRRELQRSSRQREDLLEEQRKDITNTFEETLRHRETDLRRQADELHLQLKAQEAKAAEERRQRERAMADHAHASRRAGELEARLKELELATRQAEWRMEAELKQLRDKHEAQDSDHRDALARMVRQKNELEARTAEMGHEVAALRQSLVALGQKHEEASARAEARHRDMADEAKIEIHRLEQRLKEAIARADAHDAEAQQLHVRLEQETGALRKQQLQAAAAQRQQLDEATDQLRATQRDLRAQEGELAKAQAQLDAERAEASALRLQVNELEEAAAAARRSADDRSTAAAHASALHDEAAKRCEELEAQLTAAEKTADDLRKQLHTAREHNRGITSAGLPPLATLSHDLPAVAAPSPLFSDDFGAVSPPRPLGSLADSDAPFRAAAVDTDGRQAPTSPPGFAFRTSPPAVVDPSARALADENDRLRGVVQSMRQQMEQLQSLHSTDTATAAAVAEVDEQQQEQLRHAQDHVAVLSRRLAAVQRGDLDGSTAALEDEVQLLRVQVVELNAMLGRCRTERDLALNKLARAPNPATAGNPEDGAGVGGAEETAARSSADVAELQATLQRRDAEREQLLQERTKLMQVSNQLRAELNRQMSASTADFGSPRADGTSADVSEAVQRAVAAAEERSQARAKELEDVLVQVAAENKMLKKDLRRQTRQVRAQAQLLAQQQDAAAAVAAAATALPTPPPPAAVLDTEDRAAAALVVPREEDADSVHQQPLSQPAEDEVEVIEPSPAFAMAVDGFGGLRRGTASSRATDSQRKAAAMVREMNARRLAQRSELARKGQEARERVRAMTARQNQGS